MWAFQNCLSGSKKIDERISQFFALGMWLIESEFVTISYTQFTRVHTPLLPARRLHHSPRAETWDGYKFSFCVFLSHDFKAENDNKCKLLWHSFSHTDSAPKLGGWKGYGINRDVVSRDKCYHSHTQQIFENKQSKKA